MLLADYAKKADEGRCYECGGALRAMKFRAPHDRCRKRGCPATVAHFAKLDKAMKATPPPRMKGRDFESWAVHAEKMKAYYAEHVGLLPCLACSKPGYDMGGYRTRLTRKRGEEDIDYRSRVGDRADEEAYLPFEKAGKAGKELVLFARYRWECTVCGVLQGDWHARQGVNRFGPWRFEPTAKEEELPVDGQTRAAGERL